MKKVETYMGKPMEELTREELINALNHMYTYYEDRIESLKRGFEIMNSQK